MEEENSLLTPKERERTLIDHDLLSLLQGEIEIQYVFDRLGNPVYKTNGWNIAKVSIKRDIEKWKKEGTLTLEEGIEELLNYLQVHLKSKGANQWQTRELMHILREIQSESQKKEEKRQPKPDKKDNFIK